MSGAFGFSKSSSRSKPSGDLQANEFKRLRPTIEAMLSSLLGDESQTRHIPDPLSGIPQFQGPLTAQIAPGEQQMLDFLQQQGGGGAGSDLLAKTAAGGFLPPQDGSLDPFTQGAIDAATAPFQRMQEEFLTRQLPSQATMAGQQVGPGGSAAMSRFGMIESANIAQRAAEEGAKIAFQTQEAERGRQQETIQLGQQEIQTAVTNLQAQALPRLIEEMGIERGLQEFQNRTAALLQALALASGASTPIYGTDAKSDAFGVQMSGGAGSSGGGGTGAAGGMAAVSDARLKSGLTLLAEMGSGIGVYAYTMGGEQHIGVIAQEVAMIKPDAVVEIDGTLHVYYGRL